MNKRISQFELTTTLQDNDLITLVQDGQNKNITGGNLTTSLSNTFATNERVDGIEEDISELDTKVDNNYTDLSNKIKEGDETVTNNLTSNITSYYDVLNNKIITLDEKHDTDMSEVNNTVQEWIEEIDEKSTLEQLQDALNRLTVAENTITSLAEIIANGGGSGSVPGYHTQSTATIFPLTGYYKGSSADALATTDTLNQALSKLENQIEAVSSSSGSLPVIKSGESTPPSDNHLYTSLKVAEDYLNKHGDTADGRVIFTQGLQGGTTFRSGWDGQGASLYPSNSKWNLELDNLFVRGNMTVNELTVNEIKAVGGDILVTLADMKCTEVIELSDSYQCFFDTEDGTKYNQFLANDMAICQKFDGKNVKRYWRKVNAIGDDCIYLSKDVCEAGSGVPEADDNILQLGHMYESDPDYNAQMDERRNAIFISAKGENAPRIAFYKNIDDFTLADSDGVVRERVVIGGDVTKFVGIIYQTSDTGIVRVPVYRGVWVAGNTYYYYDQVTHNGSLWICMDPNGTQDEPNENDDQWQKQVSKGDDGKAGDDAAKWVEITGDRLFLYDNPEFSGTPTPSTITLIANVYGMTDPTYEWRLLNEENTLITTRSSLQFHYSGMPTDSRTLSIRCTVTDSDGATYYDDTQLAKLGDGAQGEDAYYVDLSNGTVNIPYDSTGTIPKVDLSTISTEVYAYYGTSPISITNITYILESGNATVDIVNDKVTLTSLSTDQASIVLNVTLADDMRLTKTWYVSKTYDGENGFDGVDAAYVYMSGEQFFHYKTGESIPTPTSITLHADAFNIDQPTYKWFWAIAGTYDWQLLENETNSTLVVSYNGIYFTSTQQDEISFKCEVTGVGESFSDFMTINKVYDGENVYRGILTNENTGVPAQADGTVTDYSTASTEARLKYGSKDVTDFKLQYTQEQGSGTLEYNQSNQILRCTLLNTDSALWRVNFISPADSSTIVDTVDFVVTKSKTGEAGLHGGSNVNIYCNTSSQSNRPSRPTFSYRPASSGASSGGYIWYPDPNYSTSQTTWISSGTYDPNEGGMTYDSSVGGYWTTPEVHSGKDGEKGDKGDKGDTGSRGPSGSDGYNGPSLNFRGEYSSSKSYGWTEDPDVRDVVVYNDIYYAVSENMRHKRPFSYSPGSTYYWTPFDGNFESIATGLLFAEEATISGWQFFNTYIKSSNNWVALNGNASTDSIPFLAAGNNYGVFGWDSSNGRVNPNATLRMYPTGIIRIGNNNSMAGISGAGDGSNQTRFWAGDADRDHAPFMVKQSGALHATNATITGNITTNTLIVNSNNSWGGPGVRGIIKVSTSGLTSSSSSWSVTYSTNGFSVSRIDPTATGKCTIYHNLGLTNYAVIITSDSNISTEGMRATYGIYSRSANSVGIHAIDTDNHDHTLEGVNIIFLAYGK